MTRRRSPGRGTAGFAMLAVMFIIVAFAGVTLIALTTMTRSASSTGVLQKTAAREVRASDNALESAINMLRMDPAGDLGSFEDCLGGTAVSLPSNDRTVEVTATCEESDRAMPVRDSSLGQAPAVKLVGAEGYQSGGGFADTVLWANDCIRGDSSANSCGPWLLGIGSSNFDSQAATAFGNARPSLVHAGSMEASTQNQTLGFASNVLARRGSATIVNSASGDPAVNVAGRYEQADNGLFSVNGVDCGVSTVGHPWNVRAAQIVDADDASGLPTCGSAATGAAALNARDEIAPRPSAWDTFTTFAATPTCSGSVVSLEPGAYGKVQTAALNRLLGGACPNTTFWFKPAASGPGSYWFDVDDPTNPDGSPKSSDEWNALIISDPSVRVIFGRPTGGNDATAAASATFPKACDTEQAGVEIALSPRTSIRHKAGKVAICDRDANASTSNVPAAIWQTGTADGGWTGAPDPATSTSTITQAVGGVFGSSWLPWNSGSATISNGGNAWSIDGADATAQFTCNVIFNGKCAGDATFAARGIGNKNLDGTPASPPAAGRLDSLDLIVKGQAEGTDRSFTLWSDGKIGTQIDLLPAGSSTPICSVYFPFVPDGVGSTRPLILAFDLLSDTAESVGATSKCKQAMLGGQLTRAGLQGLGVNLTFRLNKDVTFGFGSYTNKIKLDGFELRSGWDVRPTGAVAGSGWNNPENLLATDSAHSGYTLGGCPAFGSCQTATRYVDLTGFDNTKNPHVPTDGTLAKAGIIVTGETTNSNWFVNGSFYDRGGVPDISDNSTITVTLSNLRGTTSTCVATWSRVPFWGQGLYLDLLDSNVAGTCSSVLQNAEQLVGASARVSVYVARNSWGINVNYGVRIDSVRLSTVTTGQYTRPLSPDLISIGNGPVTQAASFNIFGQVSIPRNDLNIRWNGPAPRDGNGDPVPLGGGNMILSGLGSYVGPSGEAGIICCSPTKPAERIVTLTATVKRADGTSRVRGTARVVISDVAGPGAALTVEDWDIN